MSRGSEVTGDSLRKFAQRTLLETEEVPIEQLARLALREGQRTSPLHRVHRWFARRLGSQFRAILTALSLPEDAAAEFWDRYFGHVSLEGAVVLDPFSGGGTAVVESSRCGARVIGFDIDPVAAFIARFELGASARSDSSDVARTLCDAVSQRVLPFHKTEVSKGEEVEVLHHFWVEVRTCDSCHAEFELHPHYQLAYDNEKGRQWVFCKRCHEVCELPLRRKELRCRCGTRTRIASGNLQHGKVCCPHCKSVRELSFRGLETDGPPQWRLFAQEYLEPDGKIVNRKFKAATDEDRALYSRASRDLRSLENSSGGFVPDRPIPAHPRSDRRPLIHGFTKYRELFNDRQLLHLSLLGKAISELEDTEEKQLLGLAFSEHLTTNCMYAGYAFGYRRVSPLFSVHSYRHIVRPVELNPWLVGIGRGTFPNALDKVRKGVAFAKSPTDLHPDGGRVQGDGPIGPRDGRVGSSAREVAEGKLEAAVKVQDSTDLSDVPDGSVDLVLTDPPYFDNVCYSELSDFYLVWHQALGLGESPYDDPERSAPMSQNLAAVDRSDEAVREYAEGLRKVFAECSRVLKPEGICVFTYHHGHPRAWLCLGEALARSALRCSSVLPLRGEGRGGLHSYDGTIKWDAVLVCRNVGRSSHSDEGAVVVPEEAPRRAADATLAYARRLSQEELGFAAPDRGNLYRALLAAEARIENSTTRWLPLQTALRTNFSHWGEVSDG